MYLLGIVCRFFSLYMGHNYCIVLDNRDVNKFKQDFFENIFDHDSGFCKFWVVAINFRKI